jgi:hypothetical protein
MTIAVTTTVNLAESQTLQRNRAGTSRVQQSLQAKCRTGG